MINFQQIPISEVNVYLTSAEIRRRGTIQFKDVTKIILPPKHIDLNSVRAGIESDKYVLDRVQTGYDQTTLDDRLDLNENAKAIYLSLCVAIKSWTEHELYRDLLGEQIEDLNNLIKVILAKGLKANNADWTSQDILSDIQKVSDYLKDHKSKISVSHYQRTSAISKLIAKIQQLIDELNSLIRVGPNISQSDLASIRPQSVLNQLDSAIFVQCHNNIPWVALHLRRGIEAHDDDGEMTVNLTYRITQCSWRPAYDLRVNHQESTCIGLTYIGYLKQTTDEDWNDVTLTLTAGEASDCGNPPELKPINLTFTPPPAPCHPGIMRAMRKKSTRATDDAECAAPTMSASAEVAGGQASYELRRKVTVPTGEKYQRYVITESQLQGSPMYYGAPDVSSDIFRRARLRNTSSYILLESNEVSVFWDDAFIATTQIPTVAPGEKFSAFFGTDQRVKIDVKPWTKLRKTVGTKLLGGLNDREYHSLDVSLCNLRDLSVDILLAFRVPQSTDQDIKVLPDIPYSTVQMDNDLDLTGNQRTWVYNTITQHCLLWIPGFLGQTILQFAYAIEKPQGKSIVLSR